MSNSDQKNKDRNTVDRNKDDAMGATFDKTRNKDDASGGGSFDKNGADDTYDKNKDRIPASSR